MFNEACCNLCTLGSKRETHHAHYADSRQGIPNLNALGLLVWIDIHAANANLLILKCHIRLVRFMVLTRRRSFYKYYVMFQKTHVGSSLLSRIRVIGSVSRYNSKRVDGQLHSLVGRIDLVTFPTSWRGWIYLFMPREEQCQKFGGNRPKRSICSRAVSENAMKQPLPGILVSHKRHLRDAIEKLIKDQTGGK
jgi:hypothetical protein